MLRTLVLAAAVAGYPATAGAQSVSTIFTQLPSDFGRLAAPSNVVILGSTGAASLALSPKDEPIALRVNDADTVFMPGNVIGNGATQIAAGLAVYIGGRMAHNERVGALGVNLLQAQLVSGVITQGIKLATDRTRPDGGRYSFPSGHTSSAFATAAVLQAHFGWKVGVPSYALAAYVGSARMATNHHFASDVVFGAGIGIASGRATTFHHRGTQITLTPTVTPESAALTVSVTN
jgi:membrane-associated phospholipid phosphatase